MQAQASSGLVRPAAPPAKSLAAAVVKTVPGIAVTIQGRGQDQHGLHRRLGQQSRRVLDAERPGDRRRGRAARERGGKLFTLAQVLVEVVAAGQDRAVEHGAGLAEGQRLTAEDVDQVDGASALAAVVGKPAEQVAERFPATEARHGERLQVVAAQRRRRLGGRHAASCRTGRLATALDVLRGGQIIEHNEPSPAGLVQPADEPGGDGFGVACRVDA